MTRIGTAATVDEAARAEARLAFARAALGEPLIQWRPGGKIRQRLASEPRQRV